MCITSLHIVNEKQRFVDCGSPIEEAAGIFIRCSMSCDKNYLHKSGITPCI